jgi:hypothetical protein
MKHKVSKQFKISSVHTSPITQSATNSVSPRLSISSVFDRIVNRMKIMKETALMLYLGS